MIRKFQTFLVLLLAIPGLAGSSSAGEAGAGGGGDAFQDEIAPFLRKYCTGCHGPEKRKGRLDLEAFARKGAVGEEPKLWEKVARRIQSGEMPPEEESRPGPEEVRRIAERIRAEVSRAGTSAARDPGRVTIRRLNRSDYARTVRDLLSVVYHSREEFPADDVGHGFDNIGDVLSLPPLLLEKYLNAAEKIAGEALSRPESRKILFPRDPAPEEGSGLAREAIERLAPRAFRRPVSAEEISRLLRLWETGKREGGSFDEGFRLVLEAILTSPHFLFRVEIDPAPDDPSSVHSLGPFELASRLSYFVWGSMPDGELTSKAREGALGSPAELEAQARRMLRDPRSAALVEDFAGQWLQLRSLRTAAPDPARFPAFSEELRSALQKETELFFEAVMREDRSITEFLDADWTFLNEVLARHYGIPGVAGKDFRRVSLAGTPRRGVLTQGSILTVTSNPTRTSPVKRGKWVLEQILGAPPPPPPAGVSDLSEKPEAVLSGSLRRRMEQHRADPACAVCHRGMDPLGFGLENFDAIGGYRDKDGSFPIDSSGVLPDGRSFQGPLELAAILRKEEAAFRRALAEKMLTFALGRGLEDTDRPAVEGICAALKKGGDRFSTLVIEIVKSEPFILRRGEGGAP